MDKKKLCYSCFLFFNIFLIQIFSHSLFAAMTLDPERQRDVVEVIHFVRTAKPEAYNKFREPLLEIHDYCSTPGNPVTDVSTNSDSASEQVAKIMAPNNQPAVDLLLDTMSGLDQVIPPQQKLELLIWIANIVQKSGVYTPRIKYLDEIRDNIFKYLTDIEASLQSNDLRTCTVLMSKLMSQEI